MNYMYMYIYIYIYTHTHRLSRDKDSSERGHTSTLSELHDKFEALGMERDAQVMYTYIHTHMHACMKYMINLKRWGWKEMHM